MIKPMTAAIAMMAFSLAGCATTPEAVAPTYTSSMKYDQMSCAQLNRQAVELNRGIAAATGQQQAKASNDAAMTAVSLILFWPAAFFIGGDDANTAELARLKGEAQALNETAIRKGC